MPSIINSFKKEEILRADKLNNVLDEISNNTPISKNDGSHTHVSLSEISNSSREGVLETALVNYLGGLKVAVYQFNAWNNDGTVATLVTDANTNYKTVEITTPFNDSTYYLVATVTKSINTLTLSFEETIPVSTSNIWSKVLGTIFTNSNATRFIKFDWQNHNWLGGDIYESGYGSYDFHLKVDKLTDTSVEVHGGQFIRYSRGAKYKILLTVDSGTSANFEDVATIGGISQNGYIIVTLDDDLDPTTFTPSFVSSYPTDINNSIFVLAQITWDAGSSSISEVEQFYIGDIYDQWFIALSDCLNYDVNSDPDFNLQLRNWSTAHDNTIDVNGEDYLTVKDITTELLQYITITDLKDFIWDCDEIKDCITDDNWFCSTVKTCLDGFDGTHTTLSDIDFGDYVKWDHGNHWNNKDTAEGEFNGILANASTNLYNNGKSIGKFDTTKVIDLDGQQLTTGVQENLSWDNTSVDINATPKFRVLNVTDITAWNNLDTAAFQCSGGGSFAKDLNANAFYLNSKEWNYWRANEFTAWVTGDVALIAEANAAFTAENICNITARNSFLQLSAGTHINLSPAGQLQINANVGQTVTGASNWWEKGIFVNDEGASIQTIDVPDGAGGTRQIKVLALNA